jgi:Protein of unknown function (DUF664)
MTELQYPNTKGTERELLNEYLDWYRSAILRKTEGASDETFGRGSFLRRRLCWGLSSTSHGSRSGGSQMVFAGRQVDFPTSDEDPDADWRIEPQETAEQIIAFYREACAESRAIVAGTEALDAESVRAGKRYNLRRILIHMIEETARHTGHADILRELIDGQTGD